MRPRVRPTTADLNARLGWNLTQLASLTGLPKSSLADEVKAGRLGCVRYGRGRACWISREDFAAWIAANHRGGKE